MSTLLILKICLMCHKQVLRLDDNKIADAGLTAFAKAVESGALASLKDLAVDNPEHPALKAACLARSIDVYLA